MAYQKHVFEILVEKIAKKSSCRLDCVHSGGNMVGAVHFKLSSKTLCHHNWPSIRLSPNQKATQQWLFGASHLR